MSRRYSFGSAARTMIRAAAQAERSREAAARRQQAANIRAYKQSERQARADDKDAAKQYIADRIREAEQETAEVCERESAILTLLKRALDLNPNIKFKELYQKHQARRFDISAWLAHEPKAHDFMPKKPSALVRWLSTRYAESVRDAERKFEADKASYLEKVESAKAKFDAEQQKEKDNAAEYNSKIDAMEQGLAAGDHDSVVQFYKVLIATSLKEDIDALSAEVGYARESLHLVVDLELPDFETVPEEALFKYIKTGDRIESIPRTIAKRRALYANLTCQVALKCIDTVFRGGDYAPAVDCLTLNGMLDAVDPATGQYVRVCLLSVRITCDDFAALNLRQVQPEHCLKSLKASVSRSPSELVPVRPIFELDMVDPRFVDSTDVLSGLDSRPNLMELSPNEFESLITNLFAKMGLDTKQTQASRDGGVDCVAFDQRPIFGGKVVIQAKRYKHTVGVSAVRDLFGTVQNEGASKGILVTTSGYGKASFEFAKGKPLELLDGGNLLHLLMEYANIDAKIIMPDVWTDFPTGEL